MTYQWIDFVGILGSLLPTLYSGYSSFGLKKIFCWHNRFLKP